MKHLDHLHADRFYTKLVHEGKLILEKAEGEDEEGKTVEYWGFDDAKSEAEYEGVTLNEYGNAAYFFEGKVYEAVVYLPNNEASGINEYEADDIKSLIKELMDDDSDYQDDTEYFLEMNPWAKQFVTLPSKQVNMKFAGNFGTLNFTVESDGHAMGQYQDSGMLEGSFEDGTFEGEWKNKGMEGLIKFNVSDGILNGSWKKGLEPGAMRGKWKGELVADGSSETEPAATEPEPKEEQPKDDLVSRVIEAILPDLDQYSFSQFGAILHYMIDDVGAETTGKAVAQMVEEEMHYNLQTGIKHLYDKWGNGDDEYFAKFSNLTDDFIETYIQDYNDRLPNLRKHIAKKAQENFGELGTAWSLKNGYSGYLVKDPEDWTKLKGPAGLAIRLCGCESFDQVIETGAEKEFQRHFINIFFFTLKEIEELPVFYQKNLKAMLITCIDAVYHGDPDWNLEKEEGVLTYGLGAWLDHEYGQDFNTYIVEDPIAYSGADLALFGVTGLSEIEYPVDYEQMAADLLALAL